MENASGAERNRVGRVLWLLQKALPPNMYSFARTKEYQKGRRCPQGMKAPVGLSRRRPVCVANAVCSAQQGHSDFNAREAAGCGSLRLLRALRGTRILQAAAPTAPPCFGRWPRSSPLQTKGCSPLIIPKQLSSIQKIQVAALEDFCVPPIDRPLSRCGGSSPQGSGFAFNACIICGAAAAG